MSSSDNAVCRLCRSRQKKLFLKAERCHSPKCPLFSQTTTAVKSNSRTKTTRRRRLSDYGVQLREKQGLKLIYNINERSLRHYFKLARKTKQATGEAMIQLLETRLDNVVYRFGFAVTRQMARQVVGHRHITVDGKIVNIPSFLVKPGAVISLDSEIAQSPMMKKNLASKDITLPDWVERKATIGHFIRIPKREEIEIDIDEKLIVEFYSR